MGVLLFISLLACLIKYNADYSWRNRYSLDDEYTDDLAKIDVGAVNVNAGVIDDGVSDGNSEYSAMTKVKSKRGAKSMAGTSAVTVTWTLNRSSKYPCILKYIVAFFIKHPFLNPIVARHERVNRFSRGLIHYTGLSIMLLIIICWLQGVAWVNSWW